MLTHEIRAVIPGHPLTKGSMKCVGRRGRVAHVLLESDDSGAKARWRAFIADSTRRGWPAGQQAVKGQPLGADITFTLDRPKSHYGTGRNAGKVKAAYTAAFPVGHDTGDVDKLLRLVLDALQDGDVIPDDCAVVDTLARKRYVDATSAEPDVLGHPGVVIRLYPIEVPAP
ncbi:hypothetical protein GCM10023066_00900 [Nocardioides kongjuensis]